MNTQIIYMTTNRVKRHFHSRIVLLAIVIGTLLTTAEAQSTAFSYQGKLNDNSVAANGTFDLEFRLFDVAAGSAALASQQKLNVQVADGVFSVQLDFGSNAFAGSARYIEIAVKPAGGGSFTTLSPRTPISSAPYAIKSLSAATADNASQLGGQAASNFIQTNDSRLSDARMPLAGSGSYIQNGTSAQSSNFNITGTGAANNFNAVTQYNIAGARVLAIPGFANTVLGIDAGTNTTDPLGYNTIVGYGSGTNNTSGKNNAFFGASSGSSNTTAANNSFFGQNAGYANNVGHDNTYIGKGAGQNGTDSTFNTFVGSLAGPANNYGNRDTFLGYATSASSFASNATAIGSHAFAGGSNTIVLGSVEGVNGATSGVSVGIGTSTPDTRLHVVQNEFPLGGAMIVESNREGNASIEFRNTIAGAEDWVVYAGQYSGLTFHNITRNQDVLNLYGNSGGSLGMELHGGVYIYGTLAVNQMPGGGVTPLCMNVANHLAPCSSSLRYKKDLQPFKGGLALIDRLNPITFRWKDGNMLDLGFGAEDVAKVEPLLVTHNKEGEIEGVKYDRISAVLVNAVKEQQKQIADQQKLIDAQRVMLANQQRQLNQLQRAVYTGRSRAARTARKGAK